MPLLYNADPLFPDVVRDNAALALADVKYKFEVPSVVTSDVNVCQLLSPLQYCNAVPELIDGSAPNPAAV